MSGTEVTCMLMVFFQNGGWSTSYAYALIPFLIGVLSGLQALAESYRAEFGRALANYRSLAFLLIRGLLPASVYVALINSLVIRERYLLYALICGTAAELVVRSKFYFGTGPGGEKIQFGPGALLEWLQDFFMRPASASLAMSRMKLVTQILPAQENFENLYHRIATSLEAFNPAELKELREQLAAIKAEFDNQRADSTPASLPKIDEQAKLKLGYLILNRLGEPSLKTLLS